MHQLAVILVACAGIGYCAAAVQRWRLIGRSGEIAQSRLPALWLGFAAHTAGLVIAFCIRPLDRDLLYAILGVWAGVASLLFATRYIAGPSRGLLALPVGCMALLVAMTSQAGGEQLHAEGGGAIGIVHGGFMAAYLAAVLVAGATAGLYVIAARQLRSASVRALKLPELPTLERLTERSLIVATALLMGGVATGGAAMEHAHGFSLAHPTTLIALVSLGIMVLVLAVHAAQRLSRRGFAIATIGCMALGASSLLSLLVTAHG